MFSSHINPLNFSDNCSFHVLWVISTNPQFLYYASSLKVCVWIFLNIPKNISVLPAEKLQTTLEDLDDVIWLFVPLRL